jgi:predicted nucleic acid-binding protein
MESSAIVDALMDDPANPSYLLSSRIENCMFPPWSITKWPALRGHVLGEKLAGSQLEEAAEDFSALRIEQYPLAIMMQAAQALEAPLVTADAKAA